MLDNSGVFMAESLVRSVLFRPSRLSLDNTLLSGPDDASRPTYSAQGYSRSSIHFFVPHLFHIIWEFLDHVACSCRLHFGMATRAYFRYILHW